MKIPTTPTPEETNKDRRKQEAVRLSLILSHYEQICKLRGIVLKKAGYWVIRSYIREVMKSRSVDAIIDRMDNSFSTGQLTKGNYYELKGRI